MSFLTLEKVQYLDRRVECPTPSVPVSYSLGTTTWTLPYSVATDGTQGVLAVCRKDTAVQLSCTRPSATTVAVSGQGDLSAVPIFIGILYSTQVTIPHLYYRPPEKQTGEPDQRDRLTINSVDVLYDDTTDFELDVNYTTRPPLTFPSALISPQEGRARISVHCRNTDVNFTIRTSTPGAMTLVGLDWEGRISPRARRL